MAHKILIAAYRVLFEGLAYNDLGDSYLDSIPGIDIRCHDAACHLCRPPSVPIMGEAREGRSPA